MIWAIRQAINLALAGLIAVVALGHRGDLLAPLAPVAAVAPEPSEASGGARHTPGRAHQGLNLNMGPAGGTPAQAAGSNQQVQHTGSVGTFTLASWHAPVPGGRHVSRRL